MAKILLTGGEGIVFMDLKRILKNHEVYGKINEIPSDKRFGEVDAIVIDDTFPDADKSIGLANRVNLLGKGVVLLSTKSERPDDLTQEVAYVKKPYSNEEILDAVNYVLK